MISKFIEENKEKLKEIFNNTSDLILYEFNTLCEDKALIGYLDGFVDKKILNQDLLKPLMNSLISPWEVKSTIFIANKEILNIEDGVMPITNGNVILFIEGLEFAYLFNIENLEKRSVEQPTAEAVIRGPKESFVEDIEINKTLIRRRIKNSSLVIEDYILGQQTNTKVSLFYIKDIVKPEVLEEVRKRIKAIEVDGILGTGYIEDYIEDKPSTLTSTIGDSERPDVVVGNILEGRVGILCDGSPSALTVPKLFIENLQTAEDYYISPKYVIFLRILRVFSFIMSFTLPGIYLSIILFHQEMIPTELLISIAGQREGVPLSSPIEALIMVLFFELLKESGLRLPKPIGQAVTLVGGLVIGSAAVDAGFVSAITVIVVAATGMVEFVVPAFRQMVSIYRLVFLVLGSVAGLFGISCGLVFLCVNFVSLKSFGIPYMWPIAPYNKEGMKDFVIKSPLSKMNFRPKIIASKYAKKRNK